MIEPAALSNLVSHTAQVLVIVAVGGAAHTLLRLRAPSVSYGYWRAILALCLALPWIQGRHDPAAGTSASVATGAAFAVVGPAASAAPQSALSSIDPTSLFATILALGFAARVVWLGVSAWRLRRLRVAGDVVCGEAAYEDIQRLLGIRAEVRFVPGLAMPLTFGAFRPVVLLPADIEDQPESIRRAAVTHELLHVQRRDWLWHLAEEAVLAVLWFNPAVWWLVSRIRLARESAVDELAVLVTGHRRTYIEALLAFAERSPVVAAAPFARRRHLFLRIQSLSKEAFMSSTRIVLTSALLAGCVCTGGVYAVGAFPMSASPAQDIQIAPGPLEQRAVPITPENPVPRRTSYESPMYPDVARAIDAHGTVTLRVTLDELGRIAEARATAVSFGFRPTTLSGTVKFELSAVDLEQIARGQVPNYSRMRSVDGESAVAAMTGIRAFIVAATNAVRQWRYDPPAEAPIAFPVTVAFAPNLDPVAVQSGVTTAGGGWLHGLGGSEAPLRVGGNIKAPTKIRHVNPVYPPVAQEAKVSGLVIIEALIGPDGAVQDARVLKSVPLLDQAALEAVMQWRFTPTLLNGQAVPVIMTVTVNFTLQKGFLATPGIPRERSPEVVKEVKPKYTAEAMHANVEGVVEVEATVGTGGTVGEARVLSGHPLLQESALTAVRQWEFKPLREPRTVNIELTFALRKSKR